MSTKKGKEAETKAIEFLKKEGFEILESNFYAKKLGEIDIIAKKDGVYHFCEVKSSTSYITATNNLTQSKLFKVKKSSIYYLQKNKLDVSFCIDAIIITNDEIVHLENITF